MTRGEWKKRFREALMDRFDAEHPFTIKRKAALLASEEEPDASVSAKPRRRSGPPNSKKQRKVSC